jgi:wyosine [tRNA(Phe)-imidazoG37] synthetase (radical SAM superfamily)
MAEKRFKYIYGPVSSWRLGSSLGVDLISTKKKTCTFNCIYCQLGRSRSLTAKRKVYVPTAEIIAEIEKLPRVHIDYITFSGRGEPTLAKNLGRTITAIKRLRSEPIAVLTNSSLLSRKQVRKELSLADFVMIKLDAHSQKALKLVNCPAKKIRFAAVLKGMRQFRKEFQGRLALQIMFVRQNKYAAENLAKLARLIHPDEVQINTPRRPSPVRALSSRDIGEIKKHFRGMNVVSVYDKKGKKIRPISSKDTCFRRGK